jgi:hypothetical protein
MNRRNYSFDTCRARVEIATRSPTIALEATWMVLPASMTCRDLRTNQNNGRSFATGLDGDQFNRNSIDEAAARPSVAK